MQHKMGRVNPFANQQQAQESPALPDGKANWNDRGLGYQKQQLSFRVIVILWDVVGLLMMCLDNSSET